MGRNNQWLIELNKSEDLWAKDIENLPAMINLSYEQLISMVEDGRVYGVMLQIKDLYETLLKIPIIMSLIILDSDSKYKEGSSYVEIIKAALGAPMSMGQWDTLAGVIVKSNKELHLPDSVIEILKRTRKLYNMEVTPDVPDVIKWRNSSIGHGALKFEDDISYQEEIRSLLLLLKAYFQGTEKYSIKGLYDDLALIWGEKRLIGKTIITNGENDDLMLLVKDDKYEVSNYITRRELKCYIFDSFFSKKNIIKYSSYFDGQNEMVQSKYFADLYEKYVIKSNKDFNVVSNIITREEDIILEYINMPLSYFKPRFLLDSLIDKMDNIGHGVITLFMERGTGKSAFSNQMSGLYHKVPLIKNSLSRCYHVQNAALRGVGDFINSINFSFRHSYNHYEDLWGSMDDMPSLSIDSETPAKDMAILLNYFHEKYGKEYTILLIDGIDEITENTKSIFSFIPFQEELDEGVFVVLLSRFKNEDTVQGNSVKYIENAEKNSQEIISVNRTDKSNVELLELCLNEHRKLDDTLKNYDNKDIIEKADYRFLYLKAYLEIRDNYSFDNTNESCFIESYMNYILSFYGPTQRHKLERIAVIIALYPRISISKYIEYMDCTEITYEFVGLLNDLTPLLTVIHMDGENVYEFADIAYSDYIIMTYKDIVSEVVGFFYLSLETKLESYLRYGSSVRTIDEIKCESEKELNDTIVFFSEGILNLWNRANSSDNETLRMMFYNSVHLAVFCNEMLGDSWAYYGYGSYLKNELLSCICNALIYSIDHLHDDFYKWWCQTVCEICRTKEKIVGGYGINNLARHIVEKKEFVSVYNFVVQNINTISSREDWLWIFEPNINEENILFIINNIELLKDFINYLVSEGDLALKKEWFDKLLEYNLSAEIEERLLNEKLKLCLNDDIYSIQNNLEALDYWDKIISKGYKIIDELFNESEKQLLIRIEKGDFISTQFLKKKDEAVRVLLDFNNQIIKKDDELGPIYEAYQFLENNNIKKYLSHIDIDELHSAYYERLCYERDNGDLVGFIEDQIQLVDFIIVIIRNKYKEESEFYACLNQWIKNIKPYALKDNKHTILILSRLMIEELRWYKKSRNNDKAIMLLEEYIYSIDVKAFFSHYFGRGFITEALEPEIIYDEDSLIYCTTNALVLLDFYLKNGANDKFKNLMTKIENDVVLIDSDHKSSYESQALCEIQKFRFKKFRKLIGYHSDFDCYLIDMIDNHKNTILKQLDDISRSTDFIGIAYNTELLMEYIWQTQEWEQGCDLCEALLEVFESKCYFPDEIVKSSLLQEINTINYCENIFLYYSGRKEIDAFDMKHLYSLYFLFEYKDFYNCINHSRGMIEELDKDQKQLFMGDGNINIEIYF